MRKTIDKISQFSKVVQVVSLIAIQLKVKVHWQLLFYQYLSLYIEAATLPNIITMHHIFVSEKPVIHPDKELFCFCLITRQRIP